MRKTMRASVVLDRLHKGFVYACLGVTTYGCFLLGCRFYRYFTVLKPAQQHRELVAKEELLAEGAASKDFYNSEMKQ